MTVTKHECAIIMAHTGVAMLEGNDFQIFHKYVEDLMGRKVWTHELLQLEQEIKQRSSGDFMMLCATATNE